MSEQTGTPHWLWRLEAPQWLAAAQHEWVQAQQRLHQRRICVTHLRRAAGMGLNAVLVHARQDPKVDESFDPETHWGRSYMDHLRAAAKEPYPLGEHMRQVFDRLEKISPHAPSPALVALRTGPSLLLNHALNDTQEILDACSAYCDVPSGNGYR